jgi:DNA-binding IclR family transcriptional regulator
LAKVVYRAPALDKGLDILELLAGQETPMAMPEIARALGRSKAEIYRMLLALETRGYITRGDNDDRYMVTGRLFDLGMRAPPIRNLHDAALPVMHELAERTQQSCHMGVISGDQIVVVARVESPASVGFAVRVGYRVQLLDSTSARVICAFQPPARQAELQRVLARSAPSKAALSRFQAQLAAIVKHGYVAEPSRTAEGIHDVAAPIFDGEGLGAIASLNVPVIKHRYLQMPIEEIVTHARNAAQAISERMRLG